MNKTSIKHNNEWEHQHVNTWCKHYRKRSISAIFPILDLIMLRYLFVYWSWLVFLLRGSLNAGWPKATAAIVCLRLPPGLTEPIFCWRSALGIWSIKLRLFLEFFLHKHGSFTG